MGRPLFLGTLSFRAPSMFGRPLFLGTLSFWAPSLFGHPPLFGHPLFVGTLSFRAPCICWHPLFLGTLSFWAPSLFGHPLFLGHPLLFGTCLGPCLGTGTGPGLCLSLGPCPWAEASARPGPRRMPRPSRGLGRLRQFAFYAQSVPSYVLGYILGHCLRSGSTAFAMPISRISVSKFLEYRGAHTHQTQRAFQFTKTIVLL